MVRLHGFVFVGYYCLGVGDRVFACGVLLLAYFGWYLIFVVGLLVWGLFWGVGCCIRFGFAFDLFDWFVGVFSGSDFLFVELL